VHGRGEARRAGPRAELLLGEYDLAHRRAEPTQLDGDGQAQVPGFGHLGVGLGDERGVEVVGGVVGGGDRSDTGGEGAHVVVGDCGGRSGDGGCHTVRIGRPRNRR
jgi:hypothetical protein